MTVQKSFKRLVRKRMTKTGESYTAARAQLLAGPEAGSAVGFATGRGPAVRRTGSAAVLWRPPAWDRVGERAGGQ